MTWCPAFLTKSLSNEPPVLLRKNVGRFLSQHDPRIVLGIGKRTKLDWLEVKWPQPSGLVQRFTDLPIDRYITIREGQAKWE
ncbi:MAG TPA: ASPIC/UnbV domain-containing protein [Candidatus Sulfotelmatobacter sp.]|nr:ASPIC/UnbV domain-containing protein [Candidatus Sulfotelmatobacter sp.]